MASKSTARRAAKRSAAGQRQLPRATTSRARKANTFYEEHRTDIESVHPDDREWVIKMMLAGWWDTGEPRENDRLTGPARSVYNKTKRDLANVPTVNILPAGGRNFTVFASRIS